MNNLISAAVFALGAVAIGWVGASFLGSNSLAFSVTLVIATVYCLGFAELHQFRRASVALANALQRLPQTLANLDDWLTQVPASLQNPVRLRVEGERQPLPAPMFASYLVGLLVMLGLLGTFIGMVVTLQGAVQALQGTTELAAIREGLTAPIKGLGLAFGTSVAGVAGSAMLGLMATLSRRERLQVSAQLDQRIATVLRPFSLAHNRQETFRAMQYQAQALPELVNRLQTMGEQMQQSGQVLAETLLANQQTLHHSIKDNVQELTRTLAQSLQQHLADSARQTTEILQPLLATTFDNLHHAAGQQWQQLQEQARQHLQQMDAHSRQTSADMLNVWQQQAQQLETAHQQRLAGLQQAQAQAQQHIQQASATLLEQLAQNSTELVKHQQQADADRLAQWSERFDGLAKSLLAQWQSAGDAASQQQQQAAAMLEQGTRTLLAELGEAARTAASVPQAASELIEQMRSNISNHLEHDNALLAERTHLLNELVTLISRLDSNSGDQQRAVESLVQSARNLLAESGQHFSAQLADGSAKLETLTSQLAASSLEVSALGDAFVHGVELFREANEKQLDSFQRIETALDNAAGRNNEQLAYYVAQAREIIDLSMMSQKEIFDELRRIGRHAAAAEVADV